MAYSTTNRPYRDGSSQTGVEAWIYESTHSATEVAATGFVTDGAALGLAANDVLFNKPIGSNQTFTVHFMTASTTPGEVVYSVAQKGDDRNWLPTASEGHFGSVTLASVPAESPETSRLWASYLSRWTAWNHVRTLASLVAAAPLSWPCVRGSTHRRDR
jgi:hypothetical protein